MEYTHYTDRSASKTVAQLFVGYIEYVKTALEKNGLTVVVCDWTPRNGQCANFDVPADIATFWEWI